MAARRRIDDVVRPLAVCAIAVCAFSAMGCSSGRAASYRSSLTPEAMTLSENDEEVANKLAIMTDTNLRLLNEDLARLLLIDRPSRLHRRPKPY